MTQTLGIPPVPSDFDRSVFDYDRQVEHPEVTVLRDLEMTTRDGTVLRADAYLPGREGKPIAEPVPVILDRTPYDKSIRAHFVNDPEFLVQRGYGYVFQDVRGHGASEGEFRLFGVGHDGTDGYDAVEWLAEQPWCNGVVATAGWSADCVTQLSLGVEAPPHLKAMYLAHGPSDYYQDLAGTNGALRLCHGFTYSFRNALLDRAAREDPVVAANLMAHYENLVDWYRIQPGKFVSLFDGVPSIKRWLTEWLANRDFNDYWRQPGYYFEDYYERFPDIPMFFMGSWYDFFQRGTLRNYRGLSALHSSPTYLLMTPSLHGPGPSRRGWQGDVHFGDQSVVEWNQLRLAFFDQHLRGIDVAAMSRPWVKLFVMGGGDESAIDVSSEPFPLERFARWAAEATGPGPRIKINHSGHWIEEQAWPPAASTLTAYYLHAGGGLSTEAPGADGGTSAFAADPAHPKPQIGGDWTHRPQFIGQPGKVDTIVSGGFPGPGPRDQVAHRSWMGCEDDLPLSARADVLSFRSEPLAEAVEVVGDLRVVLYASSSALDTDFAFTLIDESPPSADYPAGFSMLLRDSIIRARYRRSFDEPELLEPGRVYRFEVDIWATANRFEAGHRIRLDISGSNFPSFDVNPNTGEPIGFHTHTVVALNTVHHAGDKASHVLLPIRAAGTSGDADA